MYCKLEYWNSCYRGALLLMLLFCKQGFYSMMLKHTCFYIWKTINYSLAWKLQRKSCGMYKIFFKILFQINCSLWNQVHIKFTYVLLQIVSISKSMWLSKMLTFSFYVSPRKYSWSEVKVTQSCLTLCDPRDCSTPVFPVHHQLSELAQAHVHWVGDATQPSHPLLPPSPLALSLSQHQGLFPVSQLFTSGGQSIVYISKYNM